MMRTRKNKAAAQENAVVAGAGPDSVASGELKELETQTYEMLREAYAAVCSLAEMRAGCKMSNSRVNGVARELKELIKVMAVYIL